MPLTISNSLLTAAALALLVRLPAVAQRYTPEPPPLTTAPCKPTKKNPCPVPDAATTPAPAAATAFPFPGEATEETPAKPKQAPGQSAFPFPGEPAADVLPPASSDSSSSSSSSSSNAADATQDPDQPALKDEGTAGSTRFSRKKLPKVVIVDPNERGAEDIEVSQFYLTSGNFQAAYLRAKDATANLPADPGAHLALAEAANRLNKTDEAKAEYDATLKLDPNDVQLKAVKKALNELASSKPTKTASK